MQMTAPSKMKNLTLATMAIAILCACAGPTQRPLVALVQALEQATLFQNRDYPVLNEYRSLLGGLFGRQFGLTREQLQHVFPGAQSQDMGLV